MKQQQQKKSLRKRVKSSRNINKSYSVHTEKPNTLTTERFCLYILMYGSLLQNPLERNLQLKLQTTESEMLKLNCLYRHLGYRQKSLDTASATCLAVQQRLFACTPGELGEWVVGLHQKLHFGVK